MHNVERWVHLHKCIEVLMWINVMVPTNFWGFFCVLSTAYRALWHDVTWTENTAYPLCEYSTQLCDRLSHPDSATFRRGSIFLILCSFLKNWPNPYLKYLLLCTSTFRNVATTDNFPTSSQSEILHSLIYYLLRWHAKYYVIPPFCFSGALFCLTWLGTTGRNA